MVLNSLAPFRPLLATVLMGGIAATTLLAQEHQTASPEPASSRASTAETNSGKAFQKSGGLKDLEQSIFKPFRGLEPEGSLDGVLSQPQRPPPISNKRVKEMIERRKNWAFMSPEEIVTGKSMEETLDLPGVTKDDDETKLLSPMERYFQRLYSNDKPKSKSTPGAGKQDSILGSGKSFSSMGDSDGQEDSTAGLPATIRETQRNLKKSTDRGSKTDANSERRTSGFFSDVFALERGKISPEEERSEKAWLEAYKKSLGLDPTPTFGGHFSPLFGDPKDPYRISTPPSLMDSMPSLPQAAGQASGSGITFPNSSPFSDPSSRSMNPSSLSPALPKMDPPKSSLPPQPSFAAPRRSF